MARQQTLAYSPMASSGRGSGRDSVYESLAEVDPSHTIASPDVDDFVSTRAPI